MNTRFQPGQEPKNKLPMPDKTTLEFLYSDWKQTTKQIAEHFQVSDVTVGKWLRRQGIALRPPGIGLASRGIKPPTAAELERMIHVEHLYYREIGERYGVDQSAVMYWLDRAGVPRPVNWYDRHNNPDALAELNALYDDGMSLREIGEIHGITRIQIGKLFRDNGIQLRKDGWQGGKRFDTVSGQSVRSTYERRVADWLHEKGINFVYEPRLPFPGLSDFLVNGWYVEVWGVKNSARYALRQAEKQALYRSHCLPLIELHVHHFDRSRNNLWQRRLACCLEQVTSAPPNLSL